MSELQTIAGSFGYEQFRINNNETSVIDASDATFVVDNYGSTTNLYPVLIDGSVAGVELIGGVVEGRVPLDVEWLDAYVNSAAVMVRDAPEAIIRDWHIDQAWDGIRIAGVSPDFTIDGVVLTNIRDDAIENDYGAAGSITNSMFDGVFSGLSMTSKGLTNVSDRVVTIDNVMMRMESYLFKGSMTHQSPFKVVSNSPSMEISNTTIAIDDVNHIGQSRLETAWDSVVSGSNNYFLNMSDEPFPSDYPLPGEGWTVLQGQEARDYWAAASEDMYATLDDPDGVETTVEEPVSLEAPVIPDPIVVEDPEDASTDPPVEDTVEEVILDDIVPEPAEPDQPEPEEVVSEEAPADLPEPEPVAEVEQEPEAAPEPEPVQPITEEPVVEDTVAETPAPAQPTVEEVLFEDPSGDDTIIEFPPLEDPDPVVEEPIVEEVVADDSPKGNNGRWSRLEEDSGGSSKWHALGKQFSKKLKDSFDENTETAASNGPVDMSWYESLQLAYQGDPEPEFDLNDVSVEQEEMFL